MGYKTLFNLTISRDANLSTIGLSLFLATTILELHVAVVHARGSDLVAVIAFLVAKVKNFECILQIGNLLKEIAVRICV